MTNGSTDHRRWTWPRWVVGIAAALVIAIGIAAAALPRDVRVDGFRLVAAYPHDPEAFSQGLIFVDGQLYEGTGQNGKSSLREVDLATGQVRRIVPLERSYFGEGITKLGDQIYQLTWQNRLAIIYNAETLQPRSSFRYTGEGWGLTNDGKHLIMSDGTSTLRFLKPETGELVRRVTVRSRRGAVDKLNELEYINGEIYANLWYSDLIARINPDTGDVVGWIDLSALYPARQRPSREHVLNGIAYDEEGKRLFVTGKNWPRLYQIEVVPMTARK